MNTYTFIGKQSEYLYTILCVFMIFLKKNQLKSRLQAKNSYLCAKLLNKYSRK